MGIVQRRQQAAQHGATDLRIDTLALSSDLDPRRRPAPRGLELAAHTAGLENSTTTTTSSSPSTDDSYTFSSSKEEDASVTSPNNRDSYYTPSSERHVRWSAELAEIIDSSPTASKNPLQKLLHRRSSSGGGSATTTSSSHHHHHHHQGGLLVSPNPAEGSERKQGRRIMTPRDAVRKARRSV
ncbi:hypothetical protein M409DRAFT_26014 [Zasmidium cellare ATCC 36951]|uniref:Uncharacterized protein n=1 Tax=Zasmidium cellare ATCC 36951 TaxID=1080233 RepID=A0A6A6C9L5_ZASCE|nr:uncharacterized protein M409DRAFT_26014 [Zasmidium cellare ATCC 36951]KAF2163834.1 hypothetical protein M409DRAFT_26014 [Zasmidium cellare ATCC 36951]